MVHVFVETNWLFDVAAPRHFQRPVARELLTKAIRGEATLHIPAISFVEVRRTILTKCQPRNEADALRDFLGTARGDGTVNPGDALAAYRVLDQFESTVRAELASLDAVLQDIRATRNVDAFAANERMLEYSLELSFRDLDLKAFDQTILASVLTRADELRDEGCRTSIFCERDSDLQPWDKHGRRKPGLADLYDRHRVWVYGDFDMQGTQPPTGWPETGRS